MSIEVFDKKKQYPFIVTPVNWPNIFKPLIDFVLQDSSKPLISHAIRENLQVVQGVLLIAQLVMDKKDKPFWTKSWPSIT